MQHPKNRFNRCGRVVEHHYIHASRTGSFEEITSVGFQKPYQGKINFQIRVNASLSNTIALCYLGSGRPGATKTGRPSTMLQRFG